MDKSEKRVDAIQGEILHVYDGIEEADNELPTWWLITFYGAIVFAIFYWVTYHELESAPLPGEAYAEALAAQSGGGEASEELLLAKRDDPSAVAAGEATFQEHCAVCHLEGGQGNIGPNLTDSYWIHGGSPTDIYATVYHGQLANGMPAWGATLGDGATVDVVAFVLSLRDTNIEGKEPQGELYVPGQAAGDAAEGDAVEGDAVEGDAVEGDAAEGDAAEGEAAEGEAAEGEATEGEAADAVEGETPEADSAEEGATETDA